jgi:hypothetical protein
MPGSWAGVDIGKEHHYKHAACLSEIPLDRLDRLVDRHGEWGLGFLKSCIRCRNGGPVWYTHRDSDLAGAVFQTVRQAMYGSTARRSPGGSDRSRTRALPSGSAALLSDDLLECHAGRGRVVDRVPERGGVEGDDGVLCALPRLGPRVPGIRAVKRSPGKLADASVGLVE